jgi:glycosyltransferase involved in cell wall biosynthesis
MASRKKLRVLVLGPLPPPYHGVATYTRDLLASRDLDGVELIHVNTSDQRDDTKNIGKWDAENVRVGVSSLAELGSLCQRSDAPLVYLPISQNVPAFLRDALYIMEGYTWNKRVVIHLHGGFFKTFYAEQNAAFRGMASVALKRVSGAIVLGEKLRGMFSPYIPDEKVFVVENGVPDCGPAGPRKPEAYSTLLYMSTLTRTKGLLELIQALAILRGSSSDVKLRVAGEWQEESFRIDCMSAVDRLGLREHISFSGNVVGDLKREFLSSGSIFCLPTRYPYEGQPLAILEAMASGLAVLSTDRGVISETVVDGQTGRVLPEDSSPENIAVALSDMLSDRTKLEAYACAGRKRYLERYTLHVCHRNLARVFTSIAESGRPNSMY